MINLPYSPSGFSPFCEGFYERHRGAAVSHQVRHYAKALMHCIKASIVADAVAAAELFVRRGGGGRT